MTGPLVDASAALTDNAGLLGVLLAQWSYRNEACDQAAAVRAGHNAVSVIDAMLQELYDARSALVTEIRQDQDETMARTEFERGVDKAWVSSPSTARSRTDA